MAGILRHPRYEPVAVMIGSPPPPPAPPRSKRPPPPPPPVPLDDIDWLGGDRDAAYDPTFAAAADDLAASPTGVHPDAAEAAERLAEAERLYAEAATEAQATIGRAEAEAEALLDAARRDAAEIVDTARAEAEALRDSARSEIDEQRAAALDAAHTVGHDEGYAAGYAAGQAEATAAVRAETAAQVERITALAESAAVDRRELLHNAESEVVRLALQIARTVIQRELRTDPTIVRAIAEAALAHVAAEGLVKVRISPEDHADMSAYWEQAHGTSDGVRQFQVVADPTVPRGGVTIETRSGLVDARIETQLDEIANVLGVTANDPTLAE